LRYDSEAYKELFVNKIMKISDVNKNWKEKLRKFRGDKRRIANKMRPRTIKRFIEYLLMNKNKIASEQAP
jgi:hypothetical protein